MPDGRLRPVRPSAARGTFTVLSRPYQLTTRLRRTIRVGLDDTDRRRIASALAAHHQVVATIYGAIIDASGKVVRQTAGQQLRVRG